LKAQISGSGALDSINLPPQNDWKDFKTYAPNSNVEYSDTLGMSGVKTFEEVLIPQSPSVREIPAISFSYFDPDLKKYETITQPAVPITVRASASGVPQPVVYSNAQHEADSVPETRDIVHIKPSLGVLLNPQAPLVFRPWFLLLQAIPLLSLIAAWTWRRRTDHLANNPRLRRKLRVNELTTAGLRDLEQFAQARDSDGFFATTFRLLQEQIGERLDLPASAITEAVLDGQIQSAGGSEELISRLRELFNLCNQARYAPIRSQQELASIVPRVSAAITSLRRLEPPVARRQLQPK
jgi:hypothetical protein